MNQPQSRIYGIGGYVPPRVVTNHDLAEFMETSHEWIVERTGIEERRWVDEGMTGYWMAAQAANEALEKAGMEADQIDMIVYATLSSDYDFPGGGVLLQREMGLKPMPCLDIREQCSGFLYGLATADSFIKSGMAKTVLVVGSEIHSSGLDKSTRGRNITSLFGDGAGAAIVAVTDNPERGILSSHLYADGNEADILCKKYPGSMFHPPLSKDDIDAGHQYPDMDGPRVFKHAVTKMPKAVKEALQTNGYGVEDLNMLIPHQANLRINEMVAKQLKLSGDQVHNNIQKYGNTTAATLPLCLREALELGKVNDGDLVCFVALGSGLTWGSVLMRY